MRTGSLLLSCLLGFVLQKEAAHAQTPQVPTAVFDFLTQKEGAKLHLELDMDSLLFMSGASIIR